jgi:hypothetical protein
MKFTLLLIKFGLITATLIFVRTTDAQSLPTATQNLQLSVFAASTDTDTNLAGGENRSITAGADLTFPTFALFRPSIEARTSYPVEVGQVSSQKAFLLGPKIEYPRGRIHPYIDFLVGRGKMDYHDPGYIFGNVRYISSTTMVYSVGTGVDYDLVRDLAFKADVQLQHWNTPATASGNVTPLGLTLGAIYSFDFNPCHRRER